MLVTAHIEVLPSLNHWASGCRLARLGLIVMVQVRVAETPSVANTAPKVSRKVMLILVYWIFGSMGTSKGREDTHNQYNEPSAALPHQDKFRSHPFKTK